MNIDLDAEARMDIASLVYGHWSSAFDELKAAKALTWESAGKFCPKADWPEFHKGMVMTAEKKLAKAAHMKDSICKFSPLVYGS